ncbi:putative mitochondrial protein [Globisporangium polare]
MLRAKELVSTMMHQHVFASMPGQEATVMVMIADAMEDYTFVVDVYACLRDARVSPSPLTLELTALACAELGDWKTATEVVEFMHQAIDVMHPSSDIYENAILACYRANKWMKAKQFLDEMRSYNLQASPEIHVQCISLCVASNELTATKKLLRSYLQTFEFEPEEVEESLGELYETAIASQSLDHALFFREQLLQNGFAFTKDACANLLQLCAVQRKWHQARAVLSQFVGETSSPAAPRSSQYTREIRKLLDDMDKHGFEISLPVYNAALRNYGQLGKSEDATHVLSTMKQRGVQPDVVSYAAAMAACGTSVVESERLFREMENSGCGAPSMDAYHAYLLAPSRATQWQQVLDRYAEATSSDPQTKQLVDQDARILSLVAVAYGRMAQHQDMLQVFTNMKVRGLQPNLYVYGEAMYAYIHLGQWRYALLLFDHVRQEGFEPRKLADFAMLWDAAVLAAVTGEQVDRVGLLYSTIVSLKASISPHTAVLLIETLQSVPTATLWESFKHMERLHVVRKSLASKPTDSVNETSDNNNPKVLNAVLKRAVDERDVYFAEKLVEEAEDELELVLNSMTYSLMLRLYADKENAENFREWCDKMTEAQVKTTVFTFRAVLQHLKTLASQDDHQKHYLQSINELLELNLGDDELHHADRIGRHILDTMERRGIAPDALCFEYFLRLSQDPQHATRVLSVLETADGFHFSSNFLHALFVTLGDHPERARVREFLVKCVEDLPRGLSDDALVAFCSSSDGESALQLLETLLNTTEYELVDDQLVLFLMSVTPSSEASDDEGGQQDAVVWTSDSNGRLARTAELLIDADAALESASMAFLIQQIVGLSKTLEQGRVVATGGMQADLEVLRSLLAYALSSYSREQVHEFLSQVVQQADFVHIESVLRALDE